MDSCLFPNQLGCTETSGGTPTLCEVLTEGNVACTNIDLANNKIINSSAPTAGTDLATKAYVDSQVAGGDGLPQVLNIDNNANQNIEMNNHSLVGIGSLTNTNGNLNFSSNINDDILFNTSGTGAVAFKQTNISGTANPLITLESQSDDAPGVYMEFYKNSTTPANNDRIGVMSYYANNSAGAKKEYARLRTVVRDATADSEDAELDLLCMVNGSIETILACNKDGIDIKGGIYDISGSLGMAGQFLTSGNGSELKWVSVPVGAENLLSTLNAGNSAGGLTITNLGTPVNANDATTKAYVDSRPAETLSATLTAGNSAGSNDINMNNNDINNVDNIYVANNVECNDLVLTGLLPTISNSLAGASITMTANGPLSLLSALSHVNISAPDYVSIGSAGYTTIENLHIDNSVITKEGSTADLQFQNVASISNSATTLTVQDTVFGSNYMKPSKIQDSSNNVGSNQVLSANASGQLVWKTETSGNQSLAQVLAVGNDCSGSPINGITYLNGGPSMFVNASGQLFLDASQSVILNSGATHPIELNSLGDVVIQSGTSNTIEIQGGTDISLQIDATEKMKVEIAEITMNVPINPSAGIYDSTGSLGYNKMLTADISGNLIWATQLGLQNLESVLANGNTSGAYSISMLDGSGNRQNIAHVLELDCTDAKITTIKAGVGAMVNNVNFDTNIFINSTLPVPGPQTYSVIEFAGDGFIDANGEITVNPVDLTFAPSSKRTDISGRLHIVADNDSSVNPLLLLKSENDTTGGVYQKIIKQNNAPYGSANVSEVEYFGSDSSGATREVSRKVMKLTSNASSNYTCEELFYYAKNADNSLPKFKLGPEGFGATAGNLGYAGWGSNDNLVYTPTGTGKFVSNGRIKPVAGIEDSTSTSIGTAGQVLSSTGSGVAWTNNCPSSITVSQLTLDGGGYPLFVDGSGCKNPQFATGLQYINDTQTLIVNNLQGNASSATQAFITNVPTSGLTFYPVFATSTGNQDLKIDTSTFSYVPSSDLLTIGSLKTNTIRDNANSTGTANQVLSAGTGGGSLRWVNPISLSGAFTNIVSLGGTAPTANGSAFNATIAGINTISRILAFGYEHTQGANSGCTLDTANNRFNINTSGRFKIELTLNVRTATAGYDVLTALRINGSETTGGFAYGQAGMTGGSPWYTTANLIANYQLSSGQTVDFISRSVGAGTFNGTLLNGSSIAITRIE